MQRILNAIRSPIYLEPPFTQVFLSIPTKEQNKTRRLLKYVVGKDFNDYKRGKLRESFLDQYRQFTVDLFRGLEAQGFLQPVVYNRGKGSSAYPTIKNGDVLEGVKLYPPDCSSSLHGLIRKNQWVGTIPPDPARRKNPEVLGWTKRVTHLPGDYVPGHGTVPKGHVFLQGDNIHESDDSRTMGTVPQEYILRIHYKIVGVYNDKDPKIPKEWGSPKWLKHIAKDCPRKCDLTTDTRELKRKAVKAFSDANWNSEKCLQHLEKLINLQTAHLLFGYENTPKYFFNFDDKEAEMDTFDEPLPSHKVFIKQYLDCLI